MKSALRTVLFTYLSVIVSQRVVSALIFTGNSNQSLYLFVLGLSALYFFSRPVLRMLSLPHDGVGFIFMTFIMTIILTYAFTIFVPLLVLVPTTLSHLIIFGFVLPSKSLTAFWAGVFSSLLIAVVYTFLDWLCPRNNK